MSPCVLAALATACGGPEPPVGHAVPLDEPASQPALEFDAAYILTWDRRRIGDAVESLRPTPTGHQLVRTERISIRRGDATTHLRTRIAIELGDDLAPNRVDVVRETAGANVRGRAVRTESGGWRAEFGNAPVGGIPTAAVPLEMVPLLLARGGTGRYEGPVMLPGYGFAIGELYARPDDDAGRRVKLALVVPTGVLSHELELDPDGRVARLRAPGTVESYRVAVGDIDAPFAPPELVDAASIHVAGTRQGGDGDLVRLVVDGVTAPEPPALPAQALRRTGNRWHITLTPGFNSAAARAHVPDAGVEVDDGLRALADAIVVESGARTPMAELRALALYTDRMIDNDLSAPPPDARSAFALGRGDCTTHSTVFAAFAAARGFDVRLVTGYRLVADDAGHRLVRHRWAVVRIADRWLSVDPTYGEAPAAAVNFGLAVHGASAHQIALIDELAFAGFRDATAWFR